MFHVLSQSLQAQGSPLQNSCCMHSVPLKAELYAAWHLSVITDSTCVSLVSPTLESESPSLKGPHPASACCRDSLWSVPSRWSGSSRPNGPSSQAGGALLTDSSAQKGPQHSSLSLPISPKGSSSLPSLPSYTLWRPQGTSVLSTHSELGSGHLLGLGLAYGGHTFDLYSFVYFIF